MNCKLRLVLTTLLIIIGIGSLFTNIYYVYKFGPPYQPANGVNARDVRTFSPITLLRHKSGASKVRRSLVNVPSEAERKVISTHEKPTTTAATTTSTTSTTSKSLSKPLKSSKVKSSKATADVTTNAGYSATNKGQFNSFLLAASYSGSVGSLPISLLQLGQFAKDLGIRDIAAPWVFGYQVYGVKRLVADKGISGLAMNRLYDLKSVNNMMAQCSGTTVTLFTDFIEKAARNVVIVYFARKNFVELPQFHLLKEAELAEEDRKAQVVDCTSLIQSYSLTAGKDLVDALNAELTKSTQAFHISSFICVNNSKVVKMEQINDVIKKRQGNHTIILLNWRGYASLVKKPYDSSKYWVETKYSFPGDKCHNKLMPFHFELPRAAHQFLSYTGISGTDYLSVYVSFEYLARANDTAYANCCLKETNRVIGSMMTKYHMNHVVIIGDHSNQSSSSCDSKCVKRLVAMVTTMRSWGLNVTRFNPDVTSAKHHHPAYNLFAEVHLLSSGKRLVMVGQNLWYSQIKTSFIQHYPADWDSKLYSICISSGTYLRDVASKTVQCKVKK